MRLLLFFVLVAGAAAQPFEYSIHSLAGRERVPDGVGALDARFTSVSSVATAPTGETYVCTFNNGGIFRINTNGRVTRVFGSEVAGFSSSDLRDAGDGGPALEAELNLPKGLDVRPNGEILFSDNDNHRIRLLRPEPALVDGAVVNAAGFGPTVAPGSIAAVFGTNLAGESASAPRTPLPTRLSYLAPRRCRQRGHGASRRAVLRLEDAVQLRGSGQSGSWRSRSAGHPRQRLAGRDRLRDRRHGSRPFRARSGASHSGRWNPRERTHARSRRPRGRGRSSLPAGLRQRPW